MQSLKFLAISLLFIGPSLAFAQDIAPGIYTLQQKSSGRYLDAHDSYGNDFAAVTRERQNNKTQEWFIYKDGSGNYRIKQMFEGQFFLDSHATDEEANRVVKRLIEDKDSQRWRISGTPGSHILTQVSSGQRLDAYQSADKDFAVVTQRNEGNATQLWKIETADSSKIMLERFREGASCHRWRCGEFRNTDYSNKERSLSIVMAACNVGPENIELVARRRDVGSGWGTLHRQKIEPGECYRYYHLPPVFVGRRQHEIRVNNPRGSVYHMMRAFEDSYVEIGFF